MRLILTEASRREMAGFSALQTFWRDAASGHDCCRAQSRDVLSLSVQEGMSLTFVGLTIGLFAGLATARFLGGFLYGVKPNDPKTFAGVALLLAGTAALACCIPARRTMRVEPLVALRHE